MGPEPETDVTVWPTCDIEFEGVFKDPFVAIGRHFPDSQLVALL